VSRRAPCPDSFHQTLSSRTAAYIRPRTVFPSPQPTLHTIHLGAVDSDAFGNIIVGRLFEDGWRRGSARCLCFSLFYSLFQNVGCSGNMLIKDSLKEYQVANLDTSNTPTGWNAKYQYPRVCTLLFSVNWNRFDL
jgi:hypothetical protein